MDQKKLVELVKKLRAETGVGMMEIKAALEQADGDEKKAKEIIKELGFKKVEKKADREMHQGRVATYTHSTGKIGVMFELFCETDFVAKNEEFVAVTKDICLQIAAMNPETVDELMESDFIKDPSKKIKDLIAGLVAKFGENVKIGKMARFEI